MVDEIVKIINEEGIGEALRITALLVQPPEEIPEEERQKMQRHAAALAILSSAKNSRRLADAICKAIDEEIMFPIVEKLNLEGK